MNNKSKINFALTIFAILISLNFNSYSQFKKFTIEDIYLTNKFYYESYFEPFAMRDGEHYAEFNDEGWLCSFKYSNGELVEKILPPLYFLPEFDSNSVLSDFEFSPDESKILLFVNSTPLYRHSRLSDVYIFNRDANIIEILDKDSKIRHAEFSPDGEKVVYIKDNNIFIKYLKEKSTEQITSDGKINEIINGLPDWVYEEEFGISDFVVWSPDSKYIAFLRFDESSVKEYPLIKYNDVYPKLFTYKYPKAGEDNSVVSLFYYDTENKLKEEINLGDDKDFYIPVLKWTNSPFIFSFVKLNRLQNKFDLFHFDIRKSEVIKILTEEDKYYIDETYEVWYLKDNSFILRSERDGYMHLYFYNSDGTIRNQITKGNYEVKEILDIYEKEKKIFFIANEFSPYDYCVFSIDFDGNNKSLLSEKYGNNTISFSKTYKYIIYSHSDINTPVNISICDYKFNKIRNVVNNNFYSEVMKEYCFPKKEFFKFRNRDNIELNGWMMKPADFDKNKKYPVLFYVYGGPGSNTVLNTFINFGDMWARFLSQNGYIIVSMDGRGTGGRGAEFKKCTYMRLGILETQDQIDAAKYVSSLDFVDKSRIGIWGWSFGGYMVCMCMTSDENIFKAGIAVAPVTDFRFYDNIYTERFMRKPVENPVGYFNGSPINFADKLTGKLLLIHGSVDDNVHLQNTLQFAEKLVNAKKQFDMQIYNNKEHSILGKTTRYHLFKKMSEFIFNNL